MAAKNAQVTYTGDGTQTVFSIPFDYLKKTFIKVRVDVTELTYGTDYTVSGKQVTLSVAPATGAPVLVYRKTDKTKMVTFMDGSVLRATDMTTFEVQLLHIAEETDDKVVDDVLIHTQQAELYAQDAGESADAAQASAAAAAASAVDAQTFANSVNPGNLYTKPEADARFAPSGYGVGGPSKELTGVDLNTVSAGGLYWVDNTCTNKPAGTQYGHLIVITRQGAAHSFQLYTAWFTGDIHVRVNANNVWSAWKQLALVTGTVYNIPTSDVGGNIWIS